MRRETHDIVEIMGHEEQRHVERSTQLVDFILETPADRAINGGKRFVEQQHGRLAGQGSRQGHALTLAARQLVWSPGHLAGQVHQIQQRFRARAPRGARAMPERRHHVAQRGQVREERVLLEDEPHRPAMRRRERPGDGVRPGFGARSHGRLRRSIEPRDRTQDGRLPAAGRPEDGQHVPRGARELDVERDGTLLMDGDRQAAVSHGEDRHDATTPSSP